MKKILLWILCTIAFSPSVLAADTTRVLFIGNSFTAGENIPGLVKNFATAAGLQMEVFMHAPGGITVGDLNQGTQAHMNNPTVFNLIRNNKLDFVVLQDNQGRFVLENKFPNPAVSQVVAGHLKIRDSMRHYHSCARMIFFAGWALKNGWPDIGDGEKCIENIYQNYLTLNDSVDELISPIGLAWLRSIGQLPNVDLWSPDEAHQSAAGGYLAAATIFSTIYRLNTETVSFAAQLDTATARIMRRIAYQTVVDSLQPAGLNSYIPSLTVNGQTLVAATGFMSYEWYQNSTLLATTTTNTFTPSALGCYQVVTTDNAGCKQRSAEQCITQATGISGPETAAVTVAPNPASEYLSIETTRSNATLKKYKIISLTGQTMISGSFSSQRTIIPVVQLPEGVYVCELWINGRRISTKFVKLN